MKFFIGNFTKFHYKIVDTKTTKKNKRNAKISTHITKDEHTIKSASRNTPHKGGAQLLLQH